MQTNNVTLKASPEGPEIPVKGTIRHVSQEWFLCTPRNDHRETISSFVVYTTCSIRKNALVRFANLLRAHVNIDHLKLFSRLSGSGIFLAAELRTFTLAPPNLAKLSTRHSYCGLNNRRHYDLSCDCSVTRLLLPPSHPT